ncbi:restriction endonuclease subunit S [Cohnella soli]|uniref:Restriction endonuclease subunit S n=1 Tax=Cohnella soli TaxID=425005 RepID=A0ABW0HXR2_9BACL
MTRVKLSEITSVITKGTTPMTLGFSFNDTGINFVKVESIGENGNFLQHKFQYISDECNDKLKRSILFENDILFSIAGALGRTAIVTKDILPANTNQAIAIIRPSQKKQSCPKFIQFALKSNKVYKQFQMQKQGVAQLNLSLKNIGDLEIPFPNLENQKQIAKTLDTAVELLAIRKQQLAELDNLIKSTFYDMFGDPVENEKKWVVMKLSQLGDVNRGVSKHRPRNDPALLGGVHPLIQTGDVANADFIIRDFKQTYSDLGLKQSRKWPAGTLCITIAANIAKTALMGFDACFPDSVVGFTANKLTNNIFVFVWFGFFQKIIESQAPESAQKNINLRILSDLDVIVPPIQLQNQFAEIVTKIEEQKALVKKAIDEMQYMFDSLMSEYFD